MRIVWKFKKQKLEIMLFKKKKKKNGKTLKFSVLYIYETINKSI